MKFLDADAYYWLYRRSVIWEPTVWERNQERQKNDARPPIKSRPTCWLALFLFAQRIIMSHSRKPKILVHISVLAVINYKILAPSLCISIFFWEFGILELEFPTNQIQHSSCAIFYFELLLSNPKYFLTSLSSLYGVLLLPDKTSKKNKYIRKNGFRNLFLVCWFSIWKQSTTTSTTLERWEEKKG